MTPSLTANIGAAALFAALGVVLFLATFWVLDRLFPYTLWKEIIEEHNTALAVLLGFMLLGMSIIISAAIV
ncbi:MAG TPA: DUF350 domain-containing protein [Vicinamibacterales bacterium]